MNQFIKRLKIILRYDDISGLLIYIIPSVILSILSISYPLLSILYFIYIIFLYKRSKIVFLYALIISLFILLIFITQYIVFITYKQVDILKGMVVEKDDSSFLLKKGMYYYKVYYKNTKDLIIGKKVDVFGTNTIVTERNVPNTFNYYRYKLSKKIISEYNADKVVVNNKSISVYYLKGILINYLEKHYSNESSLYLKRIVLGISEFDNDINNNIKDEGILFLFAISGLHIGLLSRYFKKILNLLNVPVEIISILLIIFLILYSFICKESSSISRSIFMIIILELETFLNKRIERLDLLTISLVLYLTINPFSIYNVGFYLTFLSTAVIYLSKKANIFKLSLYIICFSSPLIIYSNGEISIFILFYSLFFSMVFENIIIPLSYLTFIFNPLDSIYKLIILSLNKTIEIFNVFNLKITYSISNIYFLILIYISILFIFINKKDNKALIKSSISLVLIIFINYISSIFVLFPKIIMIDVGQGDSFLIRTGFKNILIDTGYEDNYHSTITYLKSMNIKKIDAIFISHSDDDHDGELNNIKSEFKVIDVYTGIDNCDFRYNQVYIKTYALKNDDPNEGSMVCFVKIYNRTILFTGDIEKLGEEYILSKNIKDISILKVAHHGSISSSNEELIKKLKPKISLISVGINNKYGHPDKTVINRLKSVDSTIYRSDINGTVTLNFIHNLIIIDTFRKDKISIFYRLNNIGFILN